MASAPMRSARRNFHHRTHGRRIISGRVTFHGEDVEHKVKPLAVSFEFTRAAEIDLAKINKHLIVGSMKTAAIATINGELRYLRRMLRLSCKPAKLVPAPVIELLPNENKPDGTWKPRTSLGCSLSFTT